MFIVKNSQAIATALTVLSAPGLVYSGTQLYSELKAYQKNHFDTSRLNIDLTKLKFQDKTKKTTKTQPNSTISKKEESNPINLKSFYQSTVINTF